MEITCLRHLVVVAVIAFLYSVTVFCLLQDWLYWMDEITKSVYKISRAVRADQNNTVYEVMRNLSSPHDVDVYHSLKQPPGNALIQSLTSTAISPSCLKALQETHPSVL